MHPNPIYRDFSFTMSKQKCADVFHSVAISGGAITGSFVISNAFPEQSVNRWTMLLKLKFLNQEQLDKFHARGFTTEVPPRISLPIGAVATSECN